MTPEGMPDDPKGPRLPYAIVGLTAALVVAALGVSRLAWESPTQSDTSLTTLILIGELDSSSETRFEESLYNLDTFLRAQYGDDAVFSPLNTVDSNALPNDGTASFFDYANAEAAGSSIRLMDLSSERFRVLINALKPDVQATFPDELASRFTSLNWVQHTPPANVWMPQALNEQWVLIPCVLLIFVGALSLAMRSWVAAICALATSVCTVILVFGFMGWLGIPLNLLVLAIPISILAIGTSEDIHLITHAQRTHPGQRSETLKQHRMATSCTAFTTAMGFAALVSGGHEQIGSFAIIGAAAVALRFLLLHLLFPYLCQLLPATESSEESRFSRWLGDAICKQNLRLSKRFNWLLGLGVLCLLLSMLLGFLIKPSVVPAPLLRDSTEEMQPYNDHAFSFGEEFLTRVHVSGLPRETQITQRLNALYQVHQKITDALPEVSLMSEWSFWQNVSAQIGEFSTEEILEKDSAFFDQLGLLFTLPEMLGPDHVPGLPLILSCPVTDLNATSLNKLESIAVDFDGETLRLRFDADFEKTADQYNAFRKTLIYSTLITSSIIGLLIGLIYMSSIAAVTTLFCNLLPAAAVGIGVCALGIPVSPVTSLFVSLSLGVAVNDTLYLLSTYHRSIRSVSDRTEAVRSTLRSAAYPIFISTCTLSAAFLLLAFSDFREIAHLGIVITLVLLTAMFCDLWVTPVLFIKIRIIPIWELLSKEYMNVIRGRAPIFRGMPERYIRKFIYFGKIQKAQPNSDLFTEGEPGSTCIIILSGTCIVNKKSLVGHVFVSRLHAGDIAGELALETGSKRSATITTDSVVDYIEFDWDELSSFRKQHPKAASYVFFNLSQIISGRLRGTLDSLAASAHPFSTAEK